jgi:heme-degrading monooxygenase HmoA
MLTIVGRPYTAGHWLALPGREDDLVSAWSDFTGWSVEAMAGAQSFVLIRHAEDPRRFLSFGAWNDSDAVTRWRASEGFRERLGRCRALCEQFEGHDYVLMAEQRRRI